MNAKTRRNHSKTYIQQFIGLLLALVMVLALIPPVKSEAASTKSKALSAYKKLLSKSTVAVIPKGKKVCDRNDNYVTYNSSKRSNVKFTIAYIDNDNVPELILYDYKYGYGVWRYKSGKVQCVLWGDTYDVPYGYYKKKGIYVETAYSEGTPYTRCYSQYKNGKMKLKLSVFVWYEDSEDPDESTPEYYIGNTYNGTQVSKTTFNKRLKSYVGGTKITKIKLKKRVICTLGGYRF